MASSQPSKSGDWEKVEWWYVSGTITLIITIIAALGEWVFHWWADPGPWVAAGGLVLTVAQFGFGASRGAVRKSEERLAEHLLALRFGQDGVRSSQGDLLASQREMLASQREMAANQREMAASQREIAANQREMAASQREMLTLQQRLLEGQARQTDLLEQLVHSFRRQ